MDDVLMLTTGAGGGLNDGVQKGQGPPGRDHWRPAIADATWTAILTPTGGNFSREFNDLMWLDRLRRSIQPIHRSESLGPVDKRRAVCD